MMKALPSPFALPQATKALIGLVVAMAVSATAAQRNDDAMNPLEPGSSCGPAQNLYGPFDYRNAQPQQLHMVEHAHFTRKVEELRGGQTGGPAGADIQYTLGAFPNHHRALSAIDRLAQKEQRDPPTNVGLRVECWYERALRWRPNDLVARMLFADYLIRNKRSPEGISHLDLVVSKAGDNPFTHYNAGLLYLEAKAFSKSLAQAHRARELGFPRTELQQRLQAEGQWADSVAVPPSPPMPASAASAP